MVRSSAVIYQDLLANNPDFSAGMAALKNSSYDEAINDFLRARTSTTDPFISATIDNYLVGAYEYKNDQTHAIPLFQSIVQDQLHQAPYVRAYAVQSMAISYQTLSNSTIANLIFSVDPYKSMYVATSTSLTVRNLFDYATTIYPLPLSELNVADWYAMDLTNIADQYPHGNLPNDVAARVTSDRQVIKDRIAVADNDITSLKNDPHNYFNLFYALERRAVILGRLNVIGDSTLGEDPNTAFESVLALYTQHNQLADGTTRYFYARFLAHKYGVARATDIAATLSPIYDGAPQHAKPIKPYLENIRAAGGNGKQDVLLLAKIDPKFKLYLLTIGWQQSDFSGS